MVLIGKYNKLRINRFVDFGLYVQADPYGEILVPGKYVSTDWKVGDEVELFVYTDSEDRLVATTEQAMIQAGSFATLKVKKLTEIGAFLECGLVKDLLLPFSEQYHRMQNGEKVVVYAYVDPKSQRMVATSKVEKYLSSKTDFYKPKDMVQALVYQKTDLGYKVIVDQKYKGMLFADEIFADIRYGDKLKAYVEKVREDGKIDLVIYKTGYAKVVDFSEKLLDYIKSNAGYIEFTDKSDPESIYDIFGVSKKTFKKALGDLYKKELVSIEENGIRLKKK